jgi:hypothetical protein
VPNIAGSISAFFAFSKLRREDFDHEVRQVVEDRGTRLVQSGQEDFRG